MGYYSHHTLTVKPEEKQAEIIEEFREECDYARIGLDTDGTPLEEVKWYDSSKDLIRFSKKHKDVLFTLNREGEESGDLSNTYFKDGKSSFHEAEVVYPEFDESMLE